jgi:hypothetical protein
MYILIDLVVKKPGVWFLFQRMGERLIKPLYAPAGTEAWIQAPPVKLLPPPLLKTIDW